MSDEKDWSARKQPREIHADMSKEPRMMMADVIAKNALKPEKSTPSPNDYTTNKERFMKKVSGSGAALLAA